MKAIKRALERIAKPGLDAEEIARTGKLLSDVRARDNGAALRDAFNRAFPSMPGIPDDMRGLLDRLD